MLDTLTEAVAVTLDELLGDAVGDVEFAHLVEDVLDDLADWLAIAGPAA